MGWFSNIARQGLNNRALARLESEIRSELPGMSTSPLLAHFVALAISAAVYPTASSGSKESDEYCAGLLRPEVDSKTAAKIVESWLDHHRIDWNECVFRIYGCDALALVLPPDGLKPLNGDPVCASRSLNRLLGIDVSEFVRLSTVLESLSSFDRDAQSHIATAATVWALVSLANLETGHCRENFYDIAAVMYTLTDQGRDHFTADQRQMISKRANEAHDKLAPIVGKFRDAAMETIDRYDANNPAKQTAAVLLHFLATLDQAPATQIRDLVVRCLIMCAVVEKFDGSPDWEIEMGEALFQLQSTWQTWESNRASS